VLIVIASIGIAVAVGVVLTRQSVESANLDGLNRQAQLIKNNQENAGIYPFSPGNLKQLNKFLKGQQEQVRLFDLRKHTPFLTDGLRLQLQRRGAVKGTVTVNDRRYLAAAVARIHGRPHKAVVLLRPASLKAAG